MLAAAVRTRSSRRITLRGTKEVENAPATTRAAGRGIDASQKAIQMDAAMEAHKNRGREFPHWRCNSPKRGRFNFHIPSESYVGR